MLHCLLKILIKLIDNLCATISQVVFDSAIAHADFHELMTSKFVDVRNHIRQDSRICSHLRRSRYSRSTTLVATIACRPNNWNTTASRESQCHHRSQRVASQRHDISFCILEIGKRMLVNACQINATRTAQFHTKQVSVCLAYQRQVWFRKAAFLPQASNRIPVANVSVIPFVNLILDVLTRFIRLQLKSLSKGCLCQQHADDY